MNALTLCTKALLILSLLSAAPDHMSIQPGALDLSTNVLLFSQLLVLHHLPAHPILPGALDLSTKVALHAMTPLSKVAMLSTHQILDDVTVDALLDSKPYSRLPVYRGDDRTDIVG